MHVYVDLMKEVFEDLKLLIIDSNTSLTHAQYRSITPLTWQEDPQHLILNLRPKLHPNHLHLSIILDHILSTTQNSIPHIQETSHQTLKSLKTKLSILYSFKMRYQSS